MEKGTANTRKKQQKRGKFINVGLHYTVLPVYDKYIR